MWLYYFRTDGHDWVLKFTTATDGFNLNSFVRKMNEVDGPVLLLIADCSQPQSIFGAFLSGTNKAMPYGLASFQN